MVWHATHEAPGRIATAAFDAARRRPVAPGIAEVPTPRPALDPGNPTLAGRRPSATVLLVSAVTVLLLLALAAALVVPTVLAHRSAVLEGDALVALTETRDAQEAFYAAHGRYASDPAELEPTGMPVAVAVDVRVVAATADDFCLAAVAAEQEPRWFMTHDGVLTDVPCG